MMYCAEPDCPGGHPCNCVSTHRNKQRPPRPIKEEADDLFTEMFSMMGTHPYGTRTDFVLALQKRTNCDKFTAVKMAKMQFMLRDLYNAEDLGDIKRIIERMIVGDE